MERGDTALKLPEFIDVEACIHGKAALREAPTSLSVGVTNGRDAEVAFGVMTLYWKSFGHCTAIFGD